MSPAANVCPSCGEPVSQFAAGCAICGEDLVSWRREQARREASRRVPRPQVPRGISSGRSGDLMFGVVMAAVALFAPPFGLLLCGYLAYRFDRDGSVGLRNVALVCAFAALVFLLFPFGVYEKVLDSIY